MRLRFLNVKKMVLRTNLKWRKTNRGRRAPTYVKHVLRKQDRIIAKVRQHGAKKYAKKTIKFGIQCLRTVDQALALDKKNGNSFWASAISKEMKNFQVAFDMR